MKLYAGTATIDRLLRDTVPPLFRQALESHAADRWFFVRYADPDHHLRLRVHGPAGALHDGVLPELERTMRQLVDEGRIWRAQVDTYVREVERYGGPEGIDVAERIFHADSESVLEMLPCLDEGDAGEEERWRLALCGADRLLSDFGFRLDAKRAIAGTLRDHYGVPRRVDKPLRQQLAEMYRKLSKELALLLFEESAADGPLGPGLDIQRERSDRLAPLIVELKELNQAGRLAVAFPDLVESFVHMHVNRMLRSAQRAQELVLYDFLGRLYESQLSRQKGLSTREADGSSGWEGATSATRADGLGFG